MRQSELVFFVVFIALLVLPDILSQQWRWVGLWTTVIVVTLAWEAIAVATTGHTLSQQRWLLATTHPWEAWINAGSKIVAMILLAWHLLQPLRR